MIKMIHAVLLICFLSVFSCVAKQTPVQSNFPFFGTQWQLVELNNEKIKPKNNIKTPFIRFSETDRKITGNTGCNSFFGSFPSKDAPLDLGPIGMTRMACQDWMENEINFLTMLENATGYEIVQNMLLIQSGQKISARFKAMAQ